MANVINAATTGAVGLSTTADSSGIIQFQTGGVATVTLGTAGQIGFGSTPAYGTSGQILASAGTGASPSWTSTLTSISLTTPTSTGTKETKVAMAANDISLTTGNYFSKTISGATTLTVSNVPTTGTAISFILDLTNGGSATITWWSGVKWASGTAPTLTSSGRDVLAFFTHDGGTTWSGFVLGKALA